MVFIRGDLCGVAGSTLFFLVWSHSIFRFIEMAESVLFYSENVEKNSTHFVENQICLINSIFAYSILIPFSGV